MQICMNEKRMETLLQAFKDKSTLKKDCVQGNFRIEGDALYYHGADSVEYTWNNGHREIRTEGRDEILRRLPDGTVIGNASILPNVGKTSAWGNIQFNQSQTVIQRLMELDNDIQMIPFNVFQEADLDIDSFKVIDSGGGENIIRNRPNPDYEKLDYHKKQATDIPKEIKSEEHFIGSSLFTVGDKQFLFDCDRGELGHGIFNPFVVQLTEPCETVAEAYESLKPDAVKQAEKEGREVIRQGEWFFIPCEKPVIHGVDDMSIEDKIQYALSFLPYHSRNQIERVLGEEFVNDIPDAGSIAVPVIGPIRLQAGKNRPNTVETGIELDGITYCTGLVEHTGREHKPITLKGWYEAYCNTAFTSHTISGAID